MRRIARLTLTALVLLGLMTAGAFAASATSTPRPVESDLPAIVTALPTSAPETATIVADSSPVPAHPPTPAKPAKSKTTSGSGSATHPVVRTPSAPAKTPVPAPTTKKSAHSDQPKHTDHEVVEPPLHETDDDGHSADGHDHGTGH